MSTPEPLTRQRLLSIFHGYGQPRERWRVGGEFERLALRPDLSPVGFHEPHGIRALLMELAEITGWRGITEGDELVGLCGRPDPRGTGPCLTLEPGGQVELSGSPASSLLALADELRGFQASLLEAARHRPVRWASCGYSPLARLSEIGWVPKSRYRVMREYLPTRGDLAQRMMKATCAVQANYDFSDEADCARKVEAAARLAPLVTAMFANSPLMEGGETGFQSYRAHIWTRTDPDRCGFPQALLAGYSHAAWLDYLLDVPMMFVRIDGRHLPARGRSFRSFMEQGIDGQLPTIEDWELHQTSVFPEVRVKKTIEVRGADGVGSALSVACCALWTGLFYCDQALDEALQLGSDLSVHGSSAELFDRAALHGLQAQAGRAFAAWAQDLCVIARRGLGSSRPMDRRLLDPLLERVEAERSPALDMLDAWRREPSAASLLAVIGHQGG